MGGWLAESRVCPASERAWQAVRSHRGCPEGGLGRRSAPLFTVPPLKTRQQHGLVGRNLGPVPCGRRGLVRLSRSSGRKIPHEPAGGAGGRGMRMQMRPSGNSRWLVKRGRPFGAAVLQRVSEQAVPRQGVGVNRTGFDSGHGSASKPCKCWKITWGLHSPRLFSLV